MTHGLAPVSHLEFAFRITSAFLLGSLVGIERQWRQRLAGLRTNALVATGTALFIMITPLVGADGNAYQIASYVVSGIGFLAGGVIFKERLSVRGLNTAATMWCTAAIGALAGFGFMIEATIGVVAVLIANVALRPVAHFVNQRPGDDAETLSSYEIHAVCLHTHEETTRLAMVAAIKEVSIPLIALYIEAMETTHRVEIVADITLSGQAEEKLELVVSRLAVSPGVVGVSWRLVPTSDEEQAIFTES